MWLCFHLVFIADTLETNRVSLCSSLLFLNIKTVEYITIQARS